MKLYGRAKHALRDSLRRAGFDLVRHRPDPTQLEVDEFRLLPSLGIRTVIDVGAHRGEFAEMVLRAVPDCLVFSFEPLAEPHAALKERLGRHPGCEAFQMGLGDREDTLEIHRNAYTMASSFLDMDESHKAAFPFTADHDHRERVRVARLDDVLPDDRLPGPLLLKLDVQGYEDRVLAGAPRILARAKAVICEVSFASLYVGQPLFTDIHHILAIAGFSFHGLVGQLLAPHSAVPLQGDALYLRE